VGSFFSSNLTTFYEFCFSQVLFISPGIDLENTLDKTLYFHEVGILFSTMMRARLFHSGLQRIQYVCKLWRHVLDQRGPGEWGHFIWIDIA
jgi:hypothetical protein